MIKTNFQLIKDIKELFPGRNHWAFDPKYELPTLELLEEQVQRALEHPFLKDYVNRGPVEDCDNAALYSSAIIHHDWARMGKTLPEPYGRVMGTMYRGMNGGHCWNVCHTESGIVFIDFDAGGRIWQADPDQDSIFFSELS